MRQAVARLQIRNAWNWHPAGPADKRSVHINIAALLELADRNVSELFIDTQSLPQGSRRDTKGEGRFDLVFCDDSTNGCHYFFDNSRRKKVVRPGARFASRDQIFRFSWATADANRKFGEARAADAFRVEDEAKSCGHAGRQCLERVSPRTRQRATTGVRIDHDSAADRPHRSRKPQYETISAAHYERRISSYARESGRTCATKGGQGNNSAADFRRASVYANSGARS